jgi:cobaltochelatase CobS
MAEYVKVLTDEELKANQAEKLAAQVAELEKAANDNAKAFEQFAGMRNALNTLSKEEIEDLVAEQVIKANTLNKIELKVLDTTKLLSDEARHNLFPDILQSVHAGIPAALVGPAGSGKSTVCEQAAKALGLKFYLQNSVSGTHEVAGYLDAHGKYHTTTFRMAFEFGGFMFIDEVDTSDAGALKWLNTAIANGYAMFPDKADPVLRHPDFRVVIAANTYGTGADRLYVGANQLDASTLDRFVFFDFAYDEKLEMGLTDNPKWTHRVQRLRKAAVEERARIVISPRATIYGAKLLAAGWNDQVVEDRVIWKGIDPELKDRICKKAGPLTYSEKQKFKEGKPSTYFKKAA